jgi:hypothetical protein
MQRTASLKEALVMAHCNLSKKISGKSSEWDEPLDAELAMAVAGVE